MDKQYPVETTLLRTAEETKYDISINTETKTFVSGQRGIIHQSWFLAIGAVGIFAAYSGVISLQSSLNFEDSIGTTSLAICFGTSILLNAAVVPVLLHSFGAKFALLLSDFTFVVFSLANLYPAKFTLYPAAVMLGIGEAFIWPAITMFNACFGTSYALRFERFTKIKPENVMKNAEFQQAATTSTRWFTGKFYGIFSSYQIIGNLMAYGILFSDSSSVQNSTMVATARTPSNFTELHCGSRDCYVYDDSENEHSSNLEVSNPILRYALFAGYTFLQICSFMFHKIFLKEPVEHDRCKHSITLGEVIQFQRRMLNHLRSPLQILLSPLNIYNGMMMGFIFSDITRSYIACPLGVKEVGLAMTFFGVTSAIGSFLFQATSGSIGKNYLYATSVFMEICLLAFCYFWYPMNGTKSWIVYVITAIFGLPDAIRQAVLSATYPEYFPNDKSVAFSMLSMLTSCGFATAFAIGTSLCVFMKIVLMSFMLVLSALCYSIAEMYFHKIKNSTK